ncbi:hypothetical protein D8674_026316 [Pyrus ussuriensis x Pyrus communis]|uniref:Uncharacterized protein n=1 Tax=Pyrus ussuriensis x Pyrus communis TaxID=2448454 RepID=A0A5N5IBA7_9ROSA|nr:hypothetical protein D8674_026316 [Pyrus ussuriensis x Pyrus communis]
MPPRHRTTGLFVEGAIPDTKQLIIAISQAAQACGLTLPEIARSLGAQNLDGDGGGEQAEEWIEQMELILDSMSCPLEKRVMTVTFFLTGSA